MADDIEDVSFLPGDSLNRKSVYEPSVTQRCKQLVCSQGRATVIIVMVGLLILAIALIAAFARSGSGSSNCNQNLQHLQTTTSSPLDVKNETFIATNGKEFPWRNVRLPNDTVIPVSYDIWLMARLKDGIFTGKVKILCKVIKDTDTIILHIKKLNLTSEIEVVNADTKKKYEVSEHLEFVRYQQLLIKLKTRITAGSKVTLHIEYKAALVKQLSGFYLSTYKNKQNETKYLAATQFEATEARSAFPCFDEPAMKATFTLTMVREKGYITLFNMPQSGPSKPYTGDSGFEVDTFKPTVKMSTYLVAFVVCDFAKISNKTKSGTDVSVYAPKDQINQADYALHVAVKVLEFYDKLFQTPYPLPKQDLVAVPDFSAGAMENWGLILYRMTAVLYDPKRTSSHDKEWVAIVVAHELAHQWFGNLVTMKWWNDLWLNEGFASYVEFLGTDAAEPTWNMDAQFVKTHLQRALYRDCLKTSHPIQVTVNDPAEINDIFDSISYDKGASIIRMLKNFMKPEFFDKGIADYLKKYKYSNAVTKDLWQSLSKAKNGELDVKKVMDTWTLQMGFPVVTVSVNNNKMTVSQKRFLIFPDSKIKEKYQSPFGYKWDIPFIYAELGADDRFTKKFQHFDSETITLDISSDTTLVKGNYGMFGYYRVNYDDDTWKKIIDKLTTNPQLFSEGDRAGLIDDAFELARAGMMKHTTVLDMTKYLTKEEGYLPWAAALSGLDYIKNRMWDKPEFELLKKYTLNIMKDRIAALGWETKDKPQMTKMLQSLLLKEAVGSGDEDVITKGKQLFKAWMENTTNINADLRSVIYKAGIMYGGEKEWDFMLSQYKIAIVPTEKLEMFYALTLTQDDHLLERLLQFGLKNDDIKSQDLPSLIDHVAENVDGKLLAWRFVQRNWQKLRNWFGDTAFSLSRIINACTASFSSQYDHDEVEKFFKEHDAGPGSRAVETSLEKIQMNIEWLDKYHTDVEKWLHDNSSK